MRDYIILPKMNWLFVLLMLRALDFPLFGTSNSGKKIISESEKQLKSTAMDFLILREYEKTYELYRNLKFYQNSANDNFKISYVPRIAFERIREPLKSHRFHAYILGNKSNSITELFVVLHTKFLAFLTGLTYLNCRNTLGPVDNITLELDKISDDLSTDLIYFSRFELHSIVARLEKLLKQVPKIASFHTLGPQIMKPINEFIYVMPEFYKKHFESSKYIRRRHENMRSHYEQMTKDQVHEIGVQISQLQKLLEGLKLGPGLEHLRREQELTLEYDGVIQLWAQKKEIFFDPSACPSKLNIREKSHLPNLKIKPLAPEEEENNCLNHMVNTCIKLPRQEIKERLKRKENYITETIREHLIRKLKLYPYHLLYSAIEEYRLISCQIDLFQLILILSPEQPENCFINSANKRFYDLRTNFSQNLNFRKSIQKANDTTLHPYFL